MDTIVSILLLVFLTYILYLAYLSSPLINRDGTWGHNNMKPKERVRGYFDYTKELSNINKDNSDLDFTNFFKDYKSDRNDIGTGGPTSDGERLGE